MDPTVGWRGWVKPAAGAKAFLPARYYHDDLEDGDQDHDHVFTYI